LRTERRTESLDETAAIVIEMVSALASEIHPGQVKAATVILDSSLDQDLALDSLARAELLSRLEKRFGVTLSERDFAEAVTVRDLLVALRGARLPRGFQEPERVKAVEPGEAQAPPESVQTLLEVLSWHIKTLPDRPHIHFFSDEEEAEVVSYRRLRERAGLVAAGLLERGIQPGEPVAIMLPTTADYFFTFFGILLAGGVPVPLYPPVRMAQLEDHLLRQGVILANCGAATLVTMPEAIRFARILKSQRPSLKNLVTVEELSAHPGVFTEPASGAGDVTLLQYTSGSTGHPKGVVLTHANLLANIRAMGKAIAVDDTDVFVSWLPLYHDMGLIGTWLSSLYYAIPLILLSPLDFLARPKRWLWAIHRYRGTLSPAPNFAYEICLTKLTDEDLAGLDLSSWRCAFNGAEPVSPNTLERFCARFAPYGFRREAMMPVYGLAECSVGLAFPPVGRGPLIDRIGRQEFIRSARALPAPATEEKALQFVACGRPLEGHDIRVVDAAGRELPERQEGRVQFRGPSACSGYFHNLEETRRLFAGEWLETGDLGYIAEGDLFVTGRTKDLIILAGRNIYPHELEEAVGNLPGIRKGNVAVFGSTDAASGTERLVVLAETRETDPEILSGLRAKINALALELLETPVDDVILAPPRTIPKTSSGKIRRSSSRQLYEQGLLGRKGRAWWLYLRLARLALASQWQRGRREMAALAYAGYSWSLFGMAAMGTWGMVFLLPHSSRRWKFMRVTTRILARAVALPISVRGLENLPRDRPCVFVANHASYLDGYVLAACLPVEFSFVAKVELLRKAGVRLFLRRIGTEFVERFDKQRGIEDARRIGQKARQGRSLMFFPEGTFTRAPGLFPFHMGAFVAAAEAGVPVVPIALRGTRSILRSGSWFPRRGSISIQIGRPIEPDPAETDAWSRALKLRDLSRQHILRHCGEPDLTQERPPI
jgi:1-acyl-sn-glycerol-3-phosphate acyltransferase